MGAASLQVALDATGIDPQHPKVERQEPGATDEHGRRGSGRIRRLESPVPFLEGERKAEQLASGHPTDGPADGQGAGAGPTGQVVVHAAVEGAVKRPSASGCPTEAE